MQIWKFRLPTNGLIEMPKGAKILTVQTQGDPAQPCIWAICDPSAEKVAHRFEIFGTGHEMGSQAAWPDLYLGTFQLPAMGLVFHVFDLGEQACP
jgi:hypothetical protein